VFAVPLTTTRRVFPSHVVIEPDQTNGLASESYALVEQLRAVSIERCASADGNVGPAVSQRILDVIAMITGIP
jgi:mRNA-degrading endonuclease toxin of MazEF toxin-antitoxin module